MRSQPRKPRPLTTTHTTDTPHIALSVSSRNLSGPFQYDEPATLDLSIVIVTYRSRGVIDGCLRSLFGENGKEGGLSGLSAEVIVVDNASPDDTVSFIQAYFPQVKLHTSNQNLGFSRANNVGIGQAKGRYILLLNPDTIVDEGMLARCVQFLQAQPADVGAMTCRVESPDGSLQWTCSRRLITPWSENCRALLLDRVFPRSDLFNCEAEPSWDRAETRDVECLLGAFMLIRREAIEKVGGLDEQFFLMYEDVDWCKRAGDAGFRLVFWPGAKIVHLGGQSWKFEMVKTYANSHLSAMQYFRKHYGKGVATVYHVSRLGMLLKIALLYVNLLRKPKDAYTIEHIQMARAAWRSLHTGYHGINTRSTEPIRPAATV